MGQTPHFFGDKRPRNVNVSVKEDWSFPLGLFRGEPGLWFGSARYHVEEVNKKRFGGQGILKAVISRGVSIIQLNKQGYWQCLRLWGASIGSGHGP